MPCWATSRKVARVAQSETDPGALAKTFEQYPGQDEELFLENFLRHEGALVLAHVPTPPPSVRYRGWSWHMPGRVALR